PAERCVNARLADPRSVEPEILPVATRNGVVEDAVGCAGHGVHADKKCGVAAGLEERRVARPLLLDDVLAVWIEILGDERVPAVALACSVAVHDDDLGRSACLRATDGGVDLLGVEPATFLEHVLAGV